MRPGTRSPDLGTKMGQESPLERKLEAVRLGPGFAQHLMQLLQDRSAAGPVLLIQMVQRCAEFVAPLGRDLVDGSAPLIG